MDDATSVAGPSDVEQVRRARAGDVRAFESLASAVAPWAFRVASAILGSATDAEDATQHALVAAWRELPRLRDPTAFDDWLLRILLNECRMAACNRLSAQPLHDARSDEAGGSGPSSPRSSMSRDDVTGVLEAAFDRLDPDDRAILVLCHVFPMPLDRIATSLHVPVGTARWRLHEATQALVLALETVE